MKAKTRKPCSAMNEICVSPWPRPGPPSEPLELPEASEISKAVACESHVQHTPLDCSCLDRQRSKVRILHLILRLPARQMRGSEKDGVKDGRVVEDASSQGWQVQRHGYAVWEQLLWVTDAAVHQEPGTGLRSSCDHHSPAALQSLRAGRLHCNSATGLPADAAGFTGTTAQGSAGRRTHRRRSSKAFGRYEAYFGSEALAQMIRRACVLCRTVRRWSKSLVTALRARRRPGLRASSS